MMPASVRDKFFNLHLALNAADFIAASCINTSSTGLRARVYFGRRASVCAAMPLVQIIGSRPQYSVSSAQPQQVTDPVHALSRKGRK